METSTPETQPITTTTVDLPGPDLTGIAPAVAVRPVATSSGDDWWTKPATRWVSLLVATALVIYLCWLMLEPFVDVVIWAVVLVVVFYPVHRRINAKLRSPSLSAALSCLLVIVAILLPLTLITLAVVRDATDMAHTIQERKGELFDFEGDNVVARALRWADRWVDIDRVKSREYIAERAKAVSGRVASRTLNVVGGMLGAVVQIFFVIFTMFYLFRDGPRLRSGLREVMPLDRLAAHEVFLRTKDVIRASIYGSLVIATVQGVLGGLAFWVLGVPSPLLWGAVMILLCMIPMAGAFLVWGPAAIYLLAVGKWPHAIGLAVWGAVVVGSIDNVLRPKLVGDRTRMHELVIFFSVLGGIQVFGILGIVTGPAVAALAMALFEVWRQSRTAAPVTAGAIAGAAAAASVAATEPVVAANVPAPADPPPPRDAV